MIKADDIKKIATSFGVKEEDLKAAILDKDEKDLPIAFDTFEIITKTDFATRISNVEKSKYDEGKNAGEEIVKKEFKKEFGVDIKKTAPIADFVSGIKTKILADAGTKPDARITELEGDKIKLQGAIETLTKEKEKIVGEFNTKEQRRTLNDTILSKITGDTVIPKDKMLTLFHTEYEIEITDGKTRIKKGGEVLKNKTTLSDLTLDEVMPTFIQPYIGKPLGGTKKEDSPGSGPASGTMAAFNKEWEDAGKFIGSEEYNNELRTRQKAGTLKIK